MIIRLPDLVARSAQRNPGSPALTARTTTISYADLHERIELAAVGLHDLGLEAASASRSTSTRGSRRSWRCSPARGPVACSSR